MNTQITKIYEDKNFLCIDKPVGLAVHPGAGKEEQTVTSWLLDNYPELKKLNWPEKERAGIVHRLDKDTSGLMLVAKSPKSLSDLQKLFQTHKVKKVYLALVYGRLDKDAGEIKSFIGRDPHARRQKISRGIFFDFEPGAKREAETRYRLVKEYQFENEFLSLVEAILMTGRTHQIRVQFKSIGHPLIGDPIYNIKHSRKISKELGLERQFLHSYKLEFDDHQFESELPDDLQSVLKKLTVVS